MNRRFHFAGLLGIAVFLFTTPAYAQDDETALPPTTASEENALGEPEVRAGQEVEINEDNYRQFMELKDPNLQRQVIPENVFKPGSGLQKLEKLPEESQKHLRNQLREIIVQGDPWQPGDEETEYPYTPSEAASHNPALEKQEREAWGELVDSYHDRESQIYENSSGSQAARGSEQGSRNSQQNGMGATDSSGQDGEGSEGQQAGQQGDPNQAETEGTYSVNGAGNPDSNSTAGVSQNAMEFLRGLGEGGSSTGEGQQGDNTEGGGPEGESPTPSEAQFQAQAGQQAGSEQNRSENDGVPGSPGEQDSTSTAGTSQNAMEFLQGLGDGGNAEEANTAASQANQGESAGETSSASSQAKQGQGETQTNQQAMAQANGQDTAQADSQADVQGDGQTGDQDDGQAQDGQQTETIQSPSSTVTAASANPVSSDETDQESTAGASQNALEYLSGESIQANEGTSAETGSGQPDGTLTIQDLLNAQGIGDASGTDPESTNPAEQQRPDENKPDKDGDG